MSTILSSQLMIHTIFLNVDTKPFALCTVIFMSKKSQSLSAGSPESIGGLAGLSFGRRCLLASGSLVVMEIYLL